MLEMGFLKALKTILRYIRVPHQTLLFSATLGKNTHHLTRLHLKVGDMTFELSI